MLSPLDQPHCPITGYVVALKGFTASFEAAENNAIWHECIIGLLHLFRDSRCDMKPKFGIGTWTCHIGPMLHIHFDVVFCAATAHGAALMAHCFGQAAIYDVEKGEIIYVLDNDSQTPLVE